MTSRGPGAFLVSADTGETVMPRSIPHPLTARSPIHRAAFRTMPNDTFDLETWLMSVRGNTVRVTAPSPGQLGPQAARFFHSPVPGHGDDPYCDHCDAHHRLVQTDPDEVVGHCPECGRRPGMLGLGTKRRGLSPL